MSASMHELSIRSEDQGRKPGSILTRVSECVRWRISRVCKTYQKRRLDRALSASAFREIPLLERARRQHCTVDQSSGNELISITCPTFNRGRLFVERTLPSVLNQSYRNFQLIVVGDHCTDDTAERMAEVRDSRVHFINLPVRH